VLFTHEKKEEIFWLNDELSKNGFTLKYAGSNVWFFIIVQDVRFWRTNNRIASAGNDLTFDMNSGIISYDETNVLNPWNCIVNTGLSDWVQSRMNWTCIDSFFEKGDVGSLSRSVNWASFSLGSPIVLTSQVIWLRFTSPFVRL